jgi:hypothetical protein
MSGGMYGYGSLRPPPFRLGPGGPRFLPPLRTTFGGPPGYLWFLGMCGTMPPSHYDDNDDFDSEDNLYPSPWCHLLPPPWFGSSPLCTTTLPSRSPFGRGLSISPWPQPQKYYGRYYDDYDDDGYGFMPRSFYPRRCPRFKDKVGSDEVNQNLHIPLPDLKCCPLCLLSNLNLESAASSIVLQAM